MRTKGIRGNVIVVAMALLSLLAGLPAAAQIGPAVSAGEAWLASHQNADGSFGLVPELAPRDSALAVMALLGGDPASPALGNGLVYLAGVPEENTQYRALRVQALARAHRGFLPLLDSLFDFRNGSGFGAFGAHESNLFDTALAVQALAADEHERVLDILPLTDYLRSAQNPDGGWGFLPGDPSEVYYTAEVLLALAGLEELSFPALELDRACSFLVSKMAPTGSFGSSLETAVAYRALLARGYDVATLPASPVAWLLSQQHTDGSWNSDHFTTAHAVLALRAQLPNLTVTALTASPANAPIGSPVTLTATVRNSGPVSAPANDLVVRSGAVDGTERGSAAVPVLAPGAQTNVQVTVTTSGDGGNVTFHAIADGRFQVAELDEDDNARSIEVGLRRKADLAAFASSFSLTPSKPQPGANFTLRIDAQNLGETLAPASQYIVYRLVAGVPTPVRTANLGQIQPGSSAPIDVTLNLPEGEHTFEVALDTANAVTEEDEQNNHAEFTFFVVDSTRPDFAVAPTDLTVTPERPAVGQSAAISLKVRNQGGEPANVRVDLYDGDPEAGGILIKSEVRSLTHGLETTFTATYVVKAQTFSIVAVLDPLNAVLELDESNNRARRYVRDVPDPAVGFDNLEVSVAEPLAGEAVPGTVTVRNAGTAAAVSLLVEVFDGEPAAGATPVLSQRVDVPAASNRTLPFTWTATPGLRRLVAVLDRQVEMAEGREDNNRAEREVAVARAGGANLKVEAVDLSGFTHSAATLAAQGSVGVTVANRGDAPAGTPFVVRLFEDRDGSGRFSSGDRDLGSAVVPDLAQDAGETVSIAVDATLLFHRPLIWAEADAADAVAEQREDDNRLLLFAACESPLGESSVLPVEEEWFVPGFRAETTPMVAQLSDDDGDGRIDSRDIPDIVFHTEDAQGRVILALSGLGGQKLWEFRSSASFPILGRLGHLALADLDGDGVVEVIAVRSDARLMALNHKGQFLWNSETIETTAGDWTGSPEVGDLDGDGVPEIVVGRAVLSNTGKRLAIGTGNAGFNHNYYGPFGIAFYFLSPHSVIADVDLDGRAELVAGDTLYRLVKNPDGTHSLNVVWNKDVPDKLMVDGFVAVANFDTDDEAEIVYISSNQAMILNHDGSTLRRRFGLLVPFNPLQRPTLWGGPPTVADLNKDGTAEILVAGDMRLVALNANLQEIWHVDTDDYAAETAATVFDLDGKGAREVIYLDENWLYIIDGATGEVLHKRKNTSLTGNEYPVVADIDNDGQAEILVPSNRHRDGDTSTQGLHALGNPTWIGTRPIWNQYSYHVTNVQLDGTVPAAEIPSWKAGNSYRSNQELPRRARRLPNLTLGLPRIGAQTAEGVPVTLRVGNGGRESVAAGVKVRLFGGAAVAGEGATTAPLAAGEWQDVTVLWQAAGQAPTAGTAGVDTDGKVAECDEEDNEVAFELTETVLADLAVVPGTVKIVTTPTVAGQVLKLTVDVKNAGASASPATLVRLYDGDPALGKTAGEASLASIPVGQTVKVELLWDTLGAAGTHSIHAVADPDGTVPELDELNNEGLVNAVLTAPALPDLSAEKLTAQPSVVTAGQEVLLRAEVRNRGLGFQGSFDLSFRVNNAEVARVSSPGALAAGETRVIEHTLSTAGRQGALLVEAWADPLNLVAEVSNDNNKARAEVAVASSPVTAAVAADRTSYAAGETVTLNATLANGTSEARSLTLSVRILDSLGAEIATVASEALSLAPGSTSRVFTWSTGSTLPGAYSVRAELTGAAGLEASGSALFSIAQNLSAAVSLYADRDVYKPGQTVIFSGSVRNTSGNQLLTGATALLELKDAGGTLVFSQSQALPSLPPDGTAPATATWSTADAAAGRYDATLRVSGADGALLGSAATQLRIEDSSETGAGVTGELEPSPGFLGVGAPLAARFAVTNDGNADLPGLVLLVDLLRLADETVAASQSQPSPLARGASRSGAISVPTAGLVPGDYLATLYAVVGGSAVRLDSAPLRVVPGLSVADVEIAEGDSGSADAVLTVRLSPASDQTVTVDYRTVDVTATAGGDYDSASGTLSFAPGETEKTVAVRVHGDTQEETDETVLFLLERASESALADAEALVTLRDEEGCASPELLGNGGAEQDLAGWTTAGASWDRRFAEPSALAGFHAFAAVAAETGELVQDVDLSPYATRIDAGGQQLAFSGFLRTGSGLPGDRGRIVVEYLDAAKQAVLGSFDSGELTSSDSWRPVVDLRAGPAGARWARVRLTAFRSSGDNADVYFDGLSLKSIGVPVLSAMDLTVNEGDGSARFQAELSCPQTAPITLDYQTLDGTAVAGQDYAAATGSLTFAAGETSKTLEVALTSDATDEPEETFSVVWSSSADAVVLTRLTEATIRDDDAEVSLSIADAALTEGSSGTPEARLTVSLSAASGQTVTVAYATADGTAQAGSDYQAASGTLTIPAGAESAEIAVPVAADRVDEPLESFAVRLSSPSHATIADGEAAVSILDDDEVEISVLPASVTEPDTNQTASLVFEVRLSVPSTREVRVNYATVNGTAAAPSDFQAATGTLAFPAGVTSRTVTVTVVGDVAEEASETLLLRLSAPVDGTISVPEASGTIVNDDGPTVRIADVSLPEGDAGTTAFVFTVSLSAASTRTVTLAYATADGTASAEDYGSVSGTLTFAPGATSQTVTVPVTGEALEELDETFFVRLSNPGNAFIDDGEAVGTIEDDDTFLLEVRDAAAAEGGSGPLTFTVTITPAAEAEVRVDYATSDGTAVDGSDYQGVSGTLVFPAGASSQTVAVTVLQDALQEGGETFGLTLSGAAGAILGRGEARGFIADDETPSSYRLHGAIRDFRPSPQHPDFENGIANDPGIVLPLLGEDGKPVYAGLAGNSTTHGQAAFDQWYRDFPGVNLATDHAITMARASAAAKYNNGAADRDSFFPIDGRLFGNFGCCNFHFTYEVHAKFIYRGGETILHYADDDSWLFINGRLALDMGGVIAPRSATLSLDAIAASHGLVPGGVYDFDLFHAERHTSGSNYYIETTLYLQQADPGVLQFAPGPFSAFESIGTGVVLVQRIGGTGGTVSAEVATVGGTATPDADYTPLATRVTLEDGEMEKAVVVPIVADSFAEPNETIELTLRDPEGARVGGFSSAVLNIVDSGTVPTLIVEDAPVVEGSGGALAQVFLARLSVASPVPVSVSFASVDGTAVSPADHAAVSGKLTFQPGETQQVISIPIVADMVQEADETFELVFSQPVNALLPDSRATVSLLDDDVCKSVDLLRNGGLNQLTGWEQVVGTSWGTDNNPAPIEGQSFVYPRGVAAGELRQVVDVSGFARTIDTGGQLFAFEGWVRSGAEAVPDTARILVEHRNAAGQVLAAYDSGASTVTQAWRRLSDRRAAPAGTRSIAVRLLGERKTASGDLNAYFDGLTLTSLATPLLSIGDPAAVNEGNSGTVLVELPVAMSCPSSQAVTVDFLTADETASAGSDYLSALGTLGIPAGATSGRFQVAVNGDTDVEPVETFVVNLLNPVGAALLDPQARVTISAGEVLVSILDHQVVEGNSGARNLRFQVHLSAASDQEISVDYATVDETATGGVDYAPKSGTLTFAPNVRDIFVDVPVFGDTQPEEDETLLVRLSNPERVTIVDGEARGSIQEDEVFLSIGDVQVKEGAAGSSVLVRFTVTRTGPTGAPVSVNFATRDNTAQAGSDYDARSLATLDIPAGATSRQIDVRVQGDNAVEPSESFSVVLTSPVNAALADDEGTGVITDDDDCPSPNVLLNPGNELALVDGEIPHWTEARGTAWTRMAGPLEGSFNLGTLSDGDAELYQDVDLSGWAGLIDAGTQRFLFNGFVLTSQTASQSTGRIRIDYLDADKELLDVFDTGDLATNNTWKPVSDLRTLQPGVRWARVRLIALRGAGTGRAETAFDVLSLQSIGVPTLQVVGGAVVTEGDAGTAPAAFAIQVTSCVGTQPITVEYASADGLALDGIDFESTRDTAVIPAGQSSVTVTVPVKGDVLVEADEPFHLDLLSATGAGLYGRRSQAVILDDDRPGSLFLTGTLRDMSRNHPDFEKGPITADPGIVEPFLGPDRKPVYTSIVDNPTTHGQTAFDQWYRDVLGVNLAKQHTIELTPSLGDPRVFVFEDLEFFPIDGQLLGNEGFGHNYHFTYEIHTKFLYQGGERFDYKGDDDIWVFINGVLAIDLGGVAPPRSASLLLDQRAAELGIVPGRVYDFDIFYAERHTVGSSFTMSTTLFLGEAQPGVLQLSAPEYRVTEDGTAATITVTRTGGVYGEVTVGYSTADGSATAPADYAAAAGTITFRDGDGEPKTFTVPIVDDAEVEGGETVELRLADPTGGAVLGSQATALLTIEDDDEEPTAPVLAAEKVDSLLADADGDEVPSPGDTLHYEITVRNTGTGPATGVALSDLVPDHTAIVAGTVTASQGTVEGESPVQVAIGEIPAAGSVTVSFDVVIANPIPAGVTEIRNQGAVTSVELPAVLTDDPTVEGSGNVTITPVAAAPKLRAFKTASLALDADEDLVPSPGDRLEYLITLRNEGNTAAAGVVFEDEVPDHTSIVAGSVVAPQGTVESEDPVRVAVGELPAGGSATVRFQVEIDSPLPAGVREVSNQGEVTAEGLPEAVSTDDPAVVGEANPTVTAVTAAPVLSAEKTDVLVEDPGNDGTASPGDVLLYQIVLTNRGNTPATSVVFLDDVPPGTAVEAGSVQTLRGTVESESPVRVAVGEVEPGAVVTISFRVRLDDPFPAGQEAVSNHGSITSAELDEQRTDDPDTPEPGDPTLTPVPSAPELSVDDVTVAEGDGGTTDAVFTVRLSAPSPREVRVDYATSAGTATEAVDYQAASGTLTFAAGETEQTVTVPVVGDLVLETDETFEVLLSNPVEATIGDGSGLGTIANDELCASPNLLVNPGAEARLVGGEIPGWTEHLGTDWQRRAAPPVPHQGIYSFSAGTAPLAELRQDVDVSAFADRVDAGLQRFAFSARVLSLAEVPPDVARVVVEYRDATDLVALETFDSGEVAGTAGWTELADVRVVPAGTRWVRVRLLAVRFTETANDALFDTLSLTSLGTATVTVDDARVYESDAASAVFGVHLSCAFEKDVTLAYSTADGTALAGEDYVATSGTLILPAGSTVGQIPVPIVADPVREPVEAFFLNLELVEPAEAALLDSQALGTILDFCQRSPGYWKNHREVWPVDERRLGGVLYDDAQVLAFLGYSGSDAATRLAHHLSATKLNLASGSDPSILPVVEDADAFLAAHPPGSDPKGALRDLADSLKDALDAYNNACPSH